MDLAALEVGAAVALHDDALALERHAFYGREELARGERVGGPAIDAHLARAQRPGGLGAAHGD